MQQVHLTKYEYQELITSRHLNNNFHLIVLKSGIAGLVNYCINEGYIYYEDNFYHDSLKDNAFNALNEECLHAEIYLAMALVCKYYTSKLRIN